MFFAKKETFPMRMRGSSGNTLLLAAVASGALFSAVTIVNTQTLQKQVRGKAFVDRYSGQLSGRNAIEMAAVMLRKNVIEVVDPGDPNKYAIIRFKAGHSNPGNQNWTLTDNNASGGTVAARLAVKSCHANKLGASGLFQVSGGTLQNVQPDPAVGNCSGAGVITSTVEFGKYSSTGTPLVVNIPMATQGGTVSLQVRAMIRNDSTSTVVTSSSATSSTSDSSTTDSSTTGSTTGSATTGSATTGSATTGSAATGSSSTGSSSTSSSATSSGSTSSGSTSSGSTSSGSTSSGSTGNASTGSSSSSSSSSSNSSTGGGTSTGPGPGPGCTGSGVEACIDGNQLFWWYDYNDDGDCQYFTVNVPCGECPDDDAACQNAGEGCAGATGFCETKSAGACNWLECTRCGFQMVLNPLAAPPYDATDCQCPASASQPAADQNCKCDAPMVDGANPGLNCVCPNNTISDGVGGCTCPGGVADICDPTDSSTPISCLDCGTFSSGMIAGPTSCACDCSNVPPPPTAPCAAGETFNPITCNCNPQPGGCSPQCGWCSTCQTAICNPNSYSMDEGHALCGHPRKYLMLPDPYTCLSCTCSNGGSMATCFPGMNGGTWRDANYGDPNKQCCCDGCNPFDSNCHDPCPP